MGGNWLEPIKLREARQPPSRKGQTVPRGVLLTLKKFVDRLLLALQSVSCHGNSPIRFEHPEKLQKHAFSGPPFLSVQRWCKYWISRASCIPKCTACLQTCAKCFYRQFSICPRNYAYITLSTFGWILKCHRKTWVVDLELIAKIKIVQRL